MKKLYLLLAMLCMALSSFAVLVPVEKAKAVAVGFYTHFFLHDNGQPVIDDIRVTEYNNIVTMYTFTFSPTGFVIVAADDVSIPILGYSDESTIPREISNPATKEWLDGYSKEGYRQQILPC